MLILTRRTSETICVGEDITITILAVKGNQVRVGINAPRSVVVDRAEIYERKKRQLGAVGTRLLLAVVVALAVGIALANALTSCMETIAQASGG